MGFVVVSVIVVWAGLLGTAYLCRGVLGLGRGRSIALVMCCYALFAALAVERLGVSGRGLLGVAGMGVPLLAACGLIAASGGRR